ncbi:MAG: SDR family oxidoreductase [Pseudomonadales bacterium]|nr:SDR family oxidoreductase [Pseudomonadales bacterium]
MSDDLLGQTAIVTGGASGIGKATVTALLSAGANVAVLDKDEAGAQAVAAQDEKSFALPINLANISEIPSTVAAVIEKFGKIDILINCAGTPGRFQDLLKMKEDNWDFVYTVNLKAPLFLMQHIAQHMIDRGEGGRIVNISSSSAFRAQNSPVAYGSAKAALVQLTRSAAAELGPHNINVNAVAPGVTATGMTKAMGDLDKAASSGPLENLFHRVSQPEDVAAAVLFLCQPSSRQITGQTIHTSAGAVV